MNKLNLLPLNKLEYYFFEIFYRWDSEYLKAIRLEHQNKL